MALTTVNAPDAPQPSGGYAQALRLSDFDALVFVSGQIPVDIAGAVPEAFAEQCRLVWRNVEPQLRAAGLTPALTIIIAGIYDPAWLVEIEVVAAR